MNAALEKLVHLHHTEAALARVDGELALLPEKRRELEERTRLGRGQLDAARAAVDACTRTRKQHEQSVQELESRRSKYKGQLMDVKTNKEYTAMLHEIESVEREIRELEDKVLEQMERAEGLVQQVRHEEAEFKRVEETGRTERADLDARQARLTTEAARLRRERDAIAESVPEDTRELYERVAKLRGTAVAEVREGVCQTCHVKVRPQVWVELRKNDSLFQCESCSRILYYEPPPPTVAVEP